MRLFTAFEIPESLRSEVNRRVAVQRRDRPSARWIPAENLHLTLVFLGDVDAESLPRLHQVLGASFAAHGPIRLTPMAIGAFPPRGKARVLWLGFERTDGLERLQRAMAKTAAGALDRPDILEERPYRPHLTLARCKIPWTRRDVTRFAEAFTASGSLKSEAFEPAVGVLFQSELRPSGAVYRPVRKYPLGRGR